MSVISIGNANLGRNDGFPRGNAKLGVMFVFVLLLAFSLIGCLTMDMGGSAGKSMGTMNALSKNGAFRVSIRSEMDPIPINTIHSWTLHVEGSDGKAVNDAVISISGGMPAHVHGLPTEPMVTGNLGNGDYRVEGLKFHMQGQWVVTFAIAAGGKQDTVTLEFEL